MKNKANFGIGFLIGGLVGVGVSCYLKDKVKALMKSYVESEYIDVSFEEVDS